MSNSFLLQTASLNELRKESTYRKLLTINTVSTEIMNYEK